MRRALAAVSLAGMASHSAAAPGLDLSGNLAGASEQVDRGLSLSDGDPTVAASLYLDHNSGLFLGATVGRVDDPVGNDVEVEAVLGYTLPLEAYELEFTATLDSFHGEDSFAYPEIAAKLSRDLGLVYAAVGVSYAPDGRWLVRGKDAVYTYFETEVPVPKAPWLAATAHVGYEAIDDFKDRTDWGAGLVAGYKWFELSVAYEDSDSDIRIGSARVVGGLRIYF